ncbi:MAG: XrtA/PEP-CTERM system TPR-repeat protein PrsT [Pseudomonadota bacterium]
MAPGPLFRTLTFLACATIGTSLSLSTALADDRRAEKASAYYEDALVRMEKGDAKGAIVQLKNALQQDSKMLPALVLLGDAYLKTGAPLGAERVLADAERLGADRSQIIAMQVETYSLLGRNRELLERFSPEGLPAGVKYKVLVARAYAQMDLGEEKAAIQSLEEARRIDPNAAAALVAQSLGHMRQGQFDQAESLARQAITRNPTDPAGWNMKGSIAHARGDAKGALADYAKALSLDPDYHEVLIARASLLIDLGRDAEAARDVTILNKTYTSDPRSAYLKALLAGRQGKEAEVKAALLSATGALDALPIEAVIARPQLALLGGVAHYSLAQYQKAKTYLGHFLKKSPQHMGARKIYTGILLAEKDYANAIAFLEGPARARPNDPQALSMLASAYMALGQHTRAVSLLREADELSDGRSPDIATNFGLSLIGTGQDDLALVQLQKAYAAAPGVSRTGIPLATLYLKKQQIRPALQILEVVTRNEPRNLGALNLLAVAKTQAKDLAGARKIYEQILAIDRRYTPAALNLARLDRAGNKHEEARRRLLALQKVQPKNLDVLYELAQVELSLNRPQEAIRVLEKARVLNPQSLAPNLMLVDLYLRLGDRQKALTIAKDTQAGNRENLQALATLGRAYLAVGNRGLARENFRRLTQLAGFNADWQQFAAVNLMRAGDPESARYSLDKALLSKPGYLPALLLRAELEVAAGKYDAAEGQAQSLLAQHPREADVHRLMGMIAVKRQRPEEAAAAFAQAFALKKTSANAIDLHNAYSLSGKSEKARSFLQEWVAAHPADAAARRVLATALDRAGRLDEARKHYEILVRQQPDNAAVLNELAYLLLKQRKPGALALAEKAYGLVPDNASIADTYGWALVEAGQIDKGLRYLREAQVRAPDHPEIRAHLREALRRKSEQGGR